MKKFFWVTLFVGLLSVVLANGAYASSVFVEDSVDSLYGTAQNLFIARTLNNAEFGDCTSWERLAKFDSEGLETWVDGVTIDVDSIGDESGTYSFNAGDSYSNIAIILKGGNYWYAFLMPYSSASNKNWGYDKELSYLAVYGCNGDIPGVPIPGTVFLLGSGLLGMVGIRRKKNN